MDLFSTTQLSQLLSNGHEDNRDRDHAPVVKLILSGTNCVWLLSEIDPDCPDIAFGLCDLGMGFPELGNVSLSELLALCYRGLMVEQDRNFTAEFPMSVYAQAARHEQAITEDRFALNQAVNSLKCSLSRRASFGPG